MHDIIVLGLGTNMGDRYGQLQTAITLLQKEVISVSFISPIYESAALLPDQAQSEWDTPYLNMAIAGTCILSPQALLKEIKDIEKYMGRQHRDRWAPREIDIDILAFGHAVIQQEGLSIPHNDLCERSFVLLPFADIFPDWRYPLPGQYYQRTIAEIAAPYRSGKEISLWENIPPQPKSSCLMNS